MVLIPQLGPMGKCNVMQDIF